MKKELINDFTLRISQSNKSQLIVVLYDMILEYLKEAEKLYQNNSLPEFCAELKKAQACVTELMSVLDMKYKISLNYMQIYLYINKLIIDSIIKRKPVELDRAAGMITDLRDAFKEVAKQDTSLPIMGNTQQVYAGMTYGRGTLNELCDAPDLNRGFKV